LSEALHVGAGKGVAVLVALVVLGRLGAGGGGVVLGRRGVGGGGVVLGRRGVGGGGVVLGRLGAGGGGVLVAHRAVLSRYSAHGRSTSAPSRATVVSARSSGSPARAVPTTTARCRRFFGIDHGVQRQPARRSSSSPA